MLESLLVGVCMFLVFGLVALALATLTRDCEERDGR